jgi:hypothetical protein
MLITRTSMLTGVEHTFDLDITPAEIARWESGAITLEEAFPRISPEELDFLKTGVIGDEWA